MTSEKRFWDCDVFNRIMRFSVNIEDFNLLVDSKYGYKYNPPLPEYLTAFKIFENQEAFSGLIEEHFKVFRSLDVVENGDDYLLKVRNYEYIDLYDCL
jgi:hypothetical protein